MSLNQQKLFSPYQGRSMDSIISQGNVSQGVSSAVSGATALYDSTMDTGQYNENPEFSTLNNIGSTSGGDTLNKIGNAGLSSGNVYGMVIGGGAKLLGGGLDVGKFLKRDAPGIETDSSGFDTQYDLNDEVLGINSMATGKQAHREALKKTFGIGLNLARHARKKANENKRIAVERLGEAQSGYNQNQLASDQFKANLMRYRKGRTNLSNGIL